VLGNFLKPGRRRELVRNVQRHYAVTKRHACRLFALVLVYLGAANRDRARWDAPELLDWAVARERHMAFGFGVHTCIGAPLARLEAEVAMSALLARFEHVDLGQERARRLPSGVLFGFRSLPLVFR